MVLCQVEEVRFNNYNLDISQQTGMCALHDSRGFMWFGTLNGLNRYDGINIKVYEYVAGKLLANSIFSLLEDRQGDIWVGTPAGINRYKSNTDDFERFLFDSTNGNSLVSNNINGIIEDTDGNIWMASNSLLLYDREQNRITSFESPEAAAPRSNNIYGFVFEDSKQNLWYAYWHHLFMFDRKTRQFTAYDVIGENEPKLEQDEWHFLKMQEDKQGNLWIAVNNAGLISFRYKEKITDCTFYSYDENDPTSFPSKSISDILIDTKNRLWVSYAFNEQGLIQFDCSDKKIIHYVYNPNKRDGITENSYRSLYEDKTGRLWIGTKSNGFDVVDPYFHRFIHYKQGENLNSLASYNVMSFMENNSGEILIGNNNGIEIYQPKSGSFIPFKSNLQENNFSDPQSICYDDNGNLWCGTWGMGVFVFDTTNKIIARYTKNNSRLTSNIICSIVSDRDQNIYFATFGGGLVVYNQRNKKWTVHSHNDSDTNSISDNSLFTLYIDKQDALWIGTVGRGLDKMIRDDTDSIYFKHYSYYEADNTQISGPTIQSILEDSNGTLWVGTNNGLNKLNKDGNTFSSLDTKNGLPNSSIMGILEDDHRNLWISTLNGIAKLGLTDNKIRVYGTYDGLQSDEFSRAACYKTQSGHMLFGGTNGFNYFHPDSIHDNPNIPPIAFTDFKIFNKSVQFGSDSPLQVPINETKEITLSYNDNVFSFQFAALDFTHPELNHYAYKMEGFEEEWNYVGYQNSATYTNLDPGNYVFWVKASNNDNLWNEAGNSISIFIKPPFWKTWWFKGLSFILIIVGLLLFYFMRIRQLNRRNIYLEKKVSVRTKEINDKNKLLLSKTEKLNESNTLLEEQKQQIEEQSEELLVSNEQLAELNSTKDKLFSIIGHDLKNPINVIMGFSELLKIKIDSISKEKRDSFINNIFISAKNTYGLLENLLDWARTQSGHIQLDPSPIVINQLIHENLTLMKQQAKKKEINIELVDIDEDYVVLCDKRMVDTIIRNLLSNAVKFTMPNGTISISLSQEQKPGFITLSIKDTGVGMTQAEIDELFLINKSRSTKGTDGETGTGLGLILCKEFIEKNRGQIWVESESGVGTTFSITLPGAI